MLRLTFRLFLGAMCTVWHVDWSNAEQSSRKPRFPSRARSPSASEGPGGPASRNLKPYEGQRTSGATARRTRAERGRRRG